MRAILILFATLQGAFILAQETPDTLAVKQDSLKFNYKALIIPTALITYGVIGLKNHQLLDFNIQISQEVNEHIDEKLTIDDFAQYAPVLAVYGLNIAGVEGRHNLKDRTLIMATSYLIMTSAVLTTKSLSKVERPDGTSKNSFPSGHTATAFAGAEFLWQEYKDQSIWYGISGYVIATGTGVFRMYNNRHWLTDVAAGAGIGILSTKIAYWTAPWLSHVVFGKGDKTASALVPFYNGKQIGFGFAVTF